LLADPATLVRRESGSDKWDYEVTFNQDNRAHGAWEFNPCTTMWHPHFQLDRKVIGTPAGRGNTPEESLRDLIRRTEVAAAPALESEVDLADPIIAGNVAKGTPLTPQEAAAVDAVLRRLSYRLRHMQGQTQEGQAVCYSPTFFLCRDIGTIREVLTLMFTPQ
jgi:hypothetical protein